MFHRECEVALYRVRYPRMWVSEGCVCRCRPSDEEHPYLKQVRKQISTQEKEAGATVLCVGRHLRPTYDITKTPQRITVNKIRLLSYFVNVN